jgi:large subunit ribosomal protein L13
MNKAFFAKNEENKPKWHVIDATGKTLGRMSTKIADILRGKDNPQFTPHAKCGDYVVVINCNKIVLTGNKWNAKEYKSFSGWRGGLKTTVAKDIIKKHPDFIIKHSVKGMLPKNKLSDELIKRLKVYQESTHPHIAQISAK